MTSYPKGITEFPNGLMAALVKNGVSYAKRRDGTIVGPIAIGGEGEDWKIVARPSGVHQHIWYPSGRFQHVFEHAFDLVELFPDGKPEEAKLPKPVERFMFVYPNGSASTVTFETPADAQRVSVEGKPYRVRIEFLERVS